MRPLAAINRYIKLKVGSLQRAARLSRTHIPDRPALVIKRFIRQVRRAPFIQPCVINDVVWVAVLTSEEDNILRCADFVIDTSGDGNFLHATDVLQLLENFEIASLVALHGVRVEFPEH